MKFDLFIGRHSIDIWLYWKCRACFKCWNNVAIKIITKWEYYFRIIEFSSGSPVLNHRDQNSSTVPNGELSPVNCLRNCRVNWIRITWCKDNIFLSNEFQIVRKVFDYWFGIRKPLLSNFHFDEAIQLDLFYIVEKLISFGLTSFNNFVLIIATKCPSMIRIHWPNKIYEGNAVKCFSISSLIAIDKQTFRVMCLGSWMRPLVLAFSSEDKNKNRTRTHMHCFPKFWNLFQGTHTQTNAKKKKNNNSNKNNEITSVNNKLAYEIYPQ